MGKNHAQKKDTQKPRCEFWLWPGTETRNATAATPAPLPQVTPQLQSHTERTYSCCALHDRYLCMLGKLRASRLGLLQERMRGNDWYQNWMLLLTLFAVFIDDVRYLAVPKSSDGIVDLLLFISFGFFANEIIFAVIFDRAYTKSVLLYLDICATVAIVLPMYVDTLSTAEARSLVLTRIGRALRVIRVMRSARITFASAAMVFDESAKRRDTERRQQIQQRLNSLSFDATESMLNTQDLAENFYNYDKNPGPAIELQPVAKTETDKAQNTVFESTKTEGTSGVTSPTAKIGAKFSFSSKSVDPAQFIATGRPKWEQYPTPQQLNAIGYTLVGQSLLRLTAQKVVLAVLLVVVGTQLLEPFWADNTFRNGLRDMDRAFPYFNATGCFLPENRCNQTSEWCAVDQFTCCCDWLQFVEGFQADLHLANSVSSPLIRQLSIRGSIFKFESVSDLRAAEIADESFGVSYIKADISGIVATLAIWSIAKTILIVGLLLYLPMTFGRDISEILIRPLEQIYDKIQLIARKPFKNLAIHSLQASKRYEFDAIELAINKLVKLLQLGLGPAGAEIVARNMDVLGEFEPLVEGKKVNAIFGFCDIRNFTDCCECLGEHTMLFTNHVGRLVGDAVAFNRGSINKNIGDAFLAVWLLPQAVRQKASTTPKSDRTEQPTLAEIASDQSVSKESEINTANFVVVPTGTIGMEYRQQQVAQSALTAFLQIITLLPVEETIQSFALQEPVVSRMGSNFRIRMGFGLHAGWAIEGAVGSSHKIDATYLSPHVNIASRLESATKQYKTPLLMSEDFVSLLPPNIAAGCRLVDVVLVKGSQQPMSIYTSDGSENHSKLKKSKAYMQAYLSGDWASAKTCVDVFLGMFRGDGPAQTIREVMAESNFEAPEGWAGCRSIDK